MPKVSAKRQLTLPANQCRLAGIEPGDECRSFVANGRITIVRQQPGSAWGCLAHLRADDTISDRQSRQSAIERKRGRHALDAFNEVLGREGRNMKAEGRRKKDEVADLRTRTKAFALRIIRLYSGLPKRTEAQVIGRQIIRSGTSVGANYREAYRARSKAEFIAKVGDCLKEIEETGYWLELLVDSGIVPEERLESLRNECGELTAIFVTSIRNAKSNNERGA